MKSLVSFIKESHTNDDILKKEFNQSKFPTEHKDAGKDIDEEKVMSIGDRKKLESIAKDIFFWRYGNVDAGKSTRDPFYNMFNGQRIKMFLGDVNVAKKLCDANVIDFIKSYTEDTDLGPQDIYYLTAKGEEFFKNRIFGFENTK